MTRVPPNVENQISAIVALLRCARKGDDITQAELAGWLSVPGSHVSAWETRTVGLTLASLIKWAEALGYRLELRPILDGSEMDAYQLGRAHLAKEVRALLDENGGYG